MTLLSRVTSCVCPAPYPEHSRDTRLRAETGFQPRRATWLPEGSRRNEARLWIFRALHIPYATVWRRLAAVSVVSATVVAVCSVQPCACALLLLLLLLLSLQVYSTMLDFVFASAGPG